MNVLVLKHLQLNGCFGHSGWFCSCAFCAFYYSNNWYNKFFIYVQLHVLLLCIVSRLRLTGTESLSGGSWLGHSGGFHHQGSALDSEPDLRPLWGWKQQSGSVLCGDPQLRWTARRVSWDSGWFGRGRASAGVRSQLGDCRKKTDSRKQLLVSAQSQSSCSNHQWHVLSNTRIHLWKQNQSRKRSTANWVHSSLSTWIHFKWVKTVLDSKWHQKQKMRNK